MNGDYIRHTWGTDDYWRLSPDKQIAARYDAEFGRGASNAPLAADIGYVRSFHGTIEQFFDFLDRNNLMACELMFQDRALHDECQVWLAEEVEDEIWLPNYTNAADFKKDLDANDAYERFEGHLIFFTTGGPGWQADTKI